jgi:ceramide glucosyltransferase
VTVRDLAGVGHYGSIVTHGLPLAMLAALLMPGIGGALLLAMILARLALAAKVHKYAPIAPAMAYPCRRPHQLLHFLRQPVRNCD